MKHRVIVIGGGVSPEHDISLQSAMNVIRYISSEKYEVFPTMITKNGEWLSSDTPLNNKEKENFDYSLFFNLQQKKTKTTGEFIVALQSMKPSVVFMMMHGPNGEDGRIQGMLELLNIAFVGPGSTSCATSMNKLLTKLIMQQIGLKTPEYLIIRRSEWKGEKEVLLGKIRSDLKFPVFVKAPDLGSSYGLAVADDREKLEESVDGLLKTNAFLIVERYIKGTELTIPILGNTSDSSAYALPVIMIVPKKTRFFDLEAKYDNTITDEIVPAPIASKVSERCQREALRLYETLGCDGLARIDLIWESNTPYFLEVNPLPGFTSASLYPKAAKAAGMSYPELLDKLVDYALKAHKERATEVSSLQG